MKPQVLLLTAILLTPFVSLIAADATAKKPDFKVYSDPEHVDSDFKFQGEYTGTVTQGNGAAAKLGAQVRAVGNGVFRTMFFGGGLPGDGWDGKTIIQKAPSTDTTTPADATRQGEKVIIDDVAIKGPTPGGIAENAEPASLYLQAHGHPSFYRNIWLVEKK